MKKARKIRRKHTSKRAYRVTAKPAMAKPYFVRELENQIASLSSRVEDLERAIPVMEALDALRRALRTLLASW
jgi:hypothetical protein